MKINTTAALVDYMNYIADKQKVSTMNIARADIPGQLAQEVSNFKLPRITTSFNMLITSSNHLPTTNIQAASYKITTNRNNINEKTRNNVDVEKETQILSENKLELSKVTAVFKRLYDMMKKACEN